MVGFPYLLLCSIKCTTSGTIDTCRSVDGIVEHLLKQSFKQQQQQPSQSSRTGLGRQGQCPSTDLGLCACPQIMLAQGNLCIMPTPVAGTPKATSHCDGVWCEDNTSNYLHSNKRQTTQAKQLLGCKLTCHCMTHEGRKRSPPSRKQCTGN